MKKLFLGALLLANIAALAGSRSVTTTGGAADQTDAGVSLADSTYCRVSAYVTDGGNVDTCTLRLWYFDPTYKWQPSSSVNDCKCVSALLSDGGAPSAQFCDYAVSAQFGMLGAQFISGKMQDAGTVAPQVRVECWGRDIPGGNGARAQ